MAHENDRTNMECRGRDILKHLIGSENFTRRDQARSQFNKDFQSFSERVAFAEVWDRPGLGWRTRSLLCIGALAGLGLWGPLRLHVHSALNNGVKPEELNEIAIHLSIYIGLPAAGELLGIMERVLAEREAGAAEAVTTDKNL